MIFSSADPGEKGTISIVKPATKAATGTRQFPFARKVEIWIIGSSSVGMAFRRRVCCRCRLIA
jgi:hypothetical protein